MIILMEQGAAPEYVERVREFVQHEGFTPFLNPGVERMVIAVLGVIDREKALLTDRFAMLPGVERVALISEPYKLSSRSCHPEGTIVRVGDVEIGGPELVVIAGPCSVETRLQTLEAAHAVKEAGARMLRGGAFKPRTSPHSFQGLGHKGLEILAEARQETGLPIVTEVMDAQDIPLLCEFADVLQVGARNMANFRLLGRLGQTSLPVLLKRGPGSRIREMLQAAEYIMVEGNTRVILCERGINTFEDATRNTTDINAIPVLKQWSHLPVLLDPSHSTGNFRWVTPVARAGVAAGADGLIVEVHPNPGEALCDGAQSLMPDRFARLMQDVHRIAVAVGRDAALV
jgi:3-deoxy-7-phosphoheptulonate synthase